MIKIEAQRAGTVVIGEDLGLVPEGFRDTMRDGGFYGYSVLQFEKNKSGKFNDPRNNPQQTLACFSTHDTPTLKGYTTGRDIHWWQQLGWIDEAMVKQRRIDRSQDVHSLMELTAALPKTTSSLKPTLPVETDLSTELHGLIARSSSALVAVQLDDILILTDAQNLPGTTDEHPNWRRRYPIQTATLGEHESFKTTAAIMKNSGKRKP